MNKNYFAISLVMILVATQVEAVSFQGLGGGSIAYDVSEDGSVVVGDYSANQRANAFKWTESTGVTLLGDLPDGGFAREGYGVSGDGSVIAGIALNINDNTEAFMWTEGTGAQGLGYFTGSGTYGRANSVSADGDKIVGRHGDGGAFLWTPSGTQSLGFTHAYDISSDGNVIVGVDRGSAVYWTSEGGVTNIGGLAYGNGSGIAKGASSDGSIIVGGSNYGTDMEAFRWSSETGMVGLGDLPGGSKYSQALDVTLDGSIVVGQSISSGTGGMEAFLWNSTNGMLSLRETLISYGLESELQGWTLRSAHAISGDGSVIVGEGYHNGIQEAFVANISVVPEPISSMLFVFGGLLLVGRRYMRR